MSCQCILQSGPRAGEPCGRKLKAGKTACGIHQTKCLKAAPRKKSPVRRKSPKMVVVTPPKMKFSDKDREVIDFIRTTIIRKRPDLINNEMMTRLIEKKFPDVNSQRYRLMWLAMLKEKYDRWNSPECKRCTKRIEALRIPI